MSDLLTTEWKAVGNYHFFTNGQFSTGLPEQSQCFIKHWRGNYWPDCGTKNVPNVVYSDIDAAKALALFCFFLPGECFTKDEPLDIGQAFRLKKMRRAGVAVGQVDLFGGAA